uniref:Ribosomal RNA-processing protein 41 n=1 Tax=Blastobotrys adeninivorans TaxID=409370 RepID=A0A060T9F2_BLAAD
MRAVARESSSIPLPTGEQTTAGSEKSAWDQKKTIKPRPRTMSRVEIYSPEGLRTDGRRYNELRQFSCTLNTHPVAADGSSYVQMGATKVVCMVRGPREPESRSHTNVDRAYVSVSINIAPYSTTDRNKRARNDRRVQEMSMIIQRTFDQVILGHLHPRTEIAVSIHVLAQDGGMFAACVNATCLALIDAGVPMYNYVSASSAALYDSTALLDPNNLEEQELSFATVGVVGKSEKTCMLLLENRLPLDRTEPVLALAIAGCHSLQDQMDRQVRKHGKHRLEKRS